MTQYTITIRSEPSALPSAIRLRRILKTMLRVYSFRCVDIVEHASDAQAADAPTDADGTDNGDKRASVAVVRTGGNTEGHQRKMVEVKRE